MLRVIPPHAQFAAGIDARRRYYVVDDADDDELVNGVPCQEAVKKLFHTLEGFKASRCFACCALPSAAFGSCLS